MPYTKRFADTLYDPEWLRREYVDRQRSPYDIAKEIGSVPSAVHKRLVRYGLHLRSASEAQRLAPHPGSHAPRPRAEFRDTLHNRDWLHEHYVVRGLNASEIGRLARSGNPVAASNVIYALRKYGFDTKTMSEAKRGRENPNRMVPLHVASTSTLMNRANVECPAAGCALCGQDRSVVHHIDGDRENPDVSNLERLCDACHARLHAKERKLALRRVIRHHGIPMMVLHVAAREALGRSLIQPIRREENWREYRDGCCLCGTSSDLEWHHKDRNHGHNDASNLELLCKAHHAQQHALEEQLAIQILVTVFGVSRAILYQKAKNLLASRSRDPQGSLVASGVAGTSQV